MTTRENYTAAQAKQDAHLTQLSWILLAESVEGDPTPGEAAYTYAMEQVTPDPVPAPWDAPEHYSK